MNKEYDEVVKMIKNGTLPEGFARTAAEWGRLPADFDQWTMTDKEGMTVYEVAKERGTLAKEVEKRYEKERSKGLSY